MKGFSEFLASKPELKMVIFAGKGGLGKTTCSAALSYAVSSSKKVLCFSTDPQASLSDIFERNIFGKGEIEVLPNLFVVEIDADSKIAAYIQEIKQKIIDMYKTEIPPEIESYIDSSVAEPAMYESATYDAMASYLAEGSYGLYVFDMPPFGHGIRMVTMADILSAWVEKLTEAREKAKEYDEIASRLRGEKLVKEDEVLRELYDIRRRLTAFTDVMKDREKSAFFMVITPEKMSILDTEKALEMFKAVGLQLSGIVVNKVLPPEMATNPSPFIANKLKQQRECMTEIMDKFGKLVTAIIPMFPKEPRGLEGISTVAKHLMDGGIEWT
uniref:Arsenic transporting ATPase n=1 Tax=Caldiarchaeum subterraneum TaxID=311458 RepID=E6NAK6_CALS0|nr:arsenic transporting ATPase [Candidatus Caldarchaeum subterraneum]BAJ49401.1 arsenic transporting ATPase [Candidatus Caldarchaeum subterraneum]